MEYLSKEEIEKAIDCCSQKDAANKLGFCVYTLRKYIKKYRICYKHKGKMYEKNKSLPLDLSESKTNIIIGSMLGDGHIDQRGRFKMDLSLASIDYCDYLFNELTPFASSIKTFKRKKIFNTGDKWNGDFLYSRRFQTIQHKIFKNFRNDWYPVGVKIVPKNIKLNVEILLHWFCQDGSNTYGMLRFHTNGFSESDVEFLKTRLYEDLEIKSHIVKHYGNPVLVIGSRDNGCNLKVINMLSPLIKWNCFKHKIYWNEKIKRRVKKSS